MGRVLGIDPGSRVTGWGVLEGEWGRTRCVACGTFRLGDDRGMGARLKDLHAGLVGIIAEHAPDEVAVERVFVAKNADSALKLGHARGVILMAVEEAGLPLHEYTPAQVKKMVTGSGKAMKGQVGMLIRAILNLDHDPAEDAADALAIGLTHLMLGGTRTLAELAGASFGKTRGGFGAGQAGRRGR
jgi:crossover junction endodeoxyribonuclease RuvC